MKISPTSDILIRGVHSPAGVPVEIDREHGTFLVAQRLATFVAAASKAPVIETAEADPAPETTAAATPKGRKARK